LLKKSFYILVKKKLKHRGRALYVLNQRTQFDQSRTINLHHYNKSNYILNLNRVILFQCIDKQLCCWKSQLRIYKAVVLLL